MSVIKNIKKIYSDIISHWDGIKEYEELSKKFEKSIENLNERIIELERIIK